MHESLPKNKSSDCQHGHKVQGQAHRVGNAIGQLFREWGEEYIRIYKPDIRKIKLICSIRLCQTPALGGKQITCAECGSTRFVYFSCGNSQCPLCQGLKRKQWEERLRNRMLQVPYIHSIFTLPWELRGIAKMNMTQIYGLIMRSAWQTVHKLTKKPENVGGLPGMTAVLHSWGSDLKYHVHTHCLITFGGIDKDGKWVWPRRKKTIATYEDMCKTFRKTFLDGLKKAYDSGKINYHLSYEDVKKMVEKKRWVVHSRHPTTNTKILEEYLSRYICRVGISNNRLHYDEVNEEVTLRYNDYSKQKKGEPAPTAYKQLHPLTAIDQILQHVNPKYFQKSRHYGLHHAITYRSVKDKIPEKIKRNNYTTLIIFKIMRIMLGIDIEPDICPDCQAQNSLIIEYIPQDKNWIKPFLTKNKAPPLNAIHINKTKTININNRIEVRKGKKCLETGILESNTDFKSCNTPIPDGYIPF